MDPAEEDLHKAVKPEPAASEGSSHTLSSGAAAAITLGVTAFVGLLVVAVIVGYRRRRKLQVPRQPTRLSGEYGAMDASNGGQQFGLWTFVIRRKDFFLNSNFEVNKVELYEIQV